MGFEMTKEERQSFLAGVHVGVVSIPEHGRGPLTVPVWYSYKPGGDLYFITGRDSRKAKLLGLSLRISLCAQTETRPYKYVSVEGPVISVDPADLERDIRPIARRYLGAEEGDRYVVEGEAVLVRVRPERWFTVDYSKNPGQG